MSELGVVIAEKKLNKFALHGYVANGGGPIAISNGIYLKFVADGSNFPVLQVLHAGIGQEIRTQRFVRTKTIIKKQPQKQPKNEPKKKEQFKVEKDVKDRNLFDVI